MISVQLSRALRDSGLAWHPLRGDNFIVDRVEVDVEVYTLSDMTVEAHTFSSGTVLGFNGTTEWALDSVALDDALWLPREDQLRQLLGAAFEGLARVELLDFATVVYRVTVTIDAAEREFEATDASDSYARALLALLDSVV